MSGKLYISPQGRHETQIPFYVVFEKSAPSDAPMLEMNGILEEVSHHKSYEFTLYPQGKIAEGKVIRYMGELSLKEAGDYRVQVEKESQPVTLVPKTENLTFLREFGVFFIGTAILVAVLFCWFMVAKRPRSSGHEQTLS